MKACLGTVTSNKVQMSRGLPQGAPESPVIFTMIMELVLRDLIKSWISRKLAWRLDDFTLAAISYADDVVLIAVSVSAAETMVSEVIEKLKEVGLTVGAPKTHWTSFPKMMDKNITVDGSAVVWEEVLEFVGSMVCLDGNARHAIAHRTAQANKMPCKMETCVGFLMAPQIVAVEHRGDCGVAGFPLGLGCLDDGQGTERQNCELERENGGECCWSEKTARNGAGTVVETLAQDCSSMDREMQYECAGGHQRSHAQLGWTCGKYGLRRNLCEGSEMSSLQWWRWRQLNWKEVERDQWSGPHPQRFKIYRWEDMVAGEVPKFVGNRGWSVENCPRQHGLVALCSKPWKLEAIFEMWKESCTDGPGCFGDPSASGMSRTDAGAAWRTERRIVRERERFGEHLSPLSLYQAKCDIALMSWWYSAGYFDGADGFDGFDGGFEGFGGGFDGFDGSAGGFVGFEGFGGGAIGSAEAHGRAKKWCRAS